MSALQNATSLDERVAAIVADPTSLAALADRAALVPVLPTQSFVSVARNLRDEQGGLLLLLPHATPDQLTGLLDLDAWEGDRMVHAAAREWLRAIVEAYRASDAEHGALSDLIMKMDPEMWVLALTAATAIAVLDPDDDGARDRAMDEMSALLTFETPDDGFVIGAPDHALGETALQIIAAVFDDDLEMGRKLVHGIKWNLPSETEEQLLAWRKGRLADLGFPEWEEAMKLFTPLSLDAIESEEGTPAARGGEDAAIVSFGGATELLRRVLAALDPGAHGERVREFMLLVNELMAAQRFEPGDADSQARALDQGQATINLAFELLLSQAKAEDPVAHLAARVERVGFRRLFRFAYGALAKLRKAAQTLHREGRVSLDAVGSLLDRPWGPALRASVAWYPELPLESNPKKTRPIRSLGDLARATARIAEAESLARVCFEPNGLGVDPVWVTRVDEPDRLRLGDLLRTALVRRAQGLQGPFAPLEPDHVAWAREHAVHEGKLSPTLRAEFSAACTAIGAGAREEALAAVLFPRLEAELVGVELDEAGAPDLTSLGGLLTIQQVGVWLKTGA